MTGGREAGASLIGGLGVLGGEELNLPHPWTMRNNIRVTGQWRYPGKASVRPAALVRAGLLRLGEFRATGFPPERANGAVEYAAHGGSLQADGARAVTGAGWRGARPGRP